MSAEDITIGIGLVIVFVLFVTSTYAEHKEQVRKEKEQIHYEAQLEELNKELRESRAEVKRLSKLNKELRESRAEVKRLSNP